MKDHGQQQHRNISNDLKYLMFHSEPQETKTEYGREDKGAKNDLKLAMIRTIKLRAKRNIIR